MLASVQKILNIQPVENADSLDKVQVLGWQVVVKRDEFKVGDLCVYIGIDTIVPDRPEFSFLFKSNFRIRTIKLRGCLSQGIAFPLSILGLAGDWKEGDDVSAVLGVIHYEKHIPSHLGGNVKGSRPSFFPKTDEERIQNIPKVLSELSTKQFIITVKCDGTSCSIFYRNGDFGVCSRNNLMAEDERSVYWQVAKKYDLEKKLKEWGKNLVVQGEVCGPGIQKNKLQLKEVDFFVFDMYDIDKGEYVPQYELFSLARMFGLKLVPMAEMGEGFHYTMDELLEKAKGKYHDTENDREGIVVRSMNGDFSETLRNRISFKVLNNDFLLKEKE